MPIIEGGKADPNKTGITYWGHNPGMTQSPLPMLESRLEYLELLYSEGTGAEVHERVSPSNSASRVRELVKEVRRLQKVIAELERDQPVAVSVTAPLVTLARRPVPTWVPVLTEDPASERE